MNRICILAAVLALFGLIVSGAAVALPAGGTPTRLEVVVQSGAYRITAGDGGQRIVMDGFGMRMEPGAPMLPEKNVLIALPPGARVRRIEAQGVGSALLPGVYRIAPAPPFAPLAEPPLRRELASRMRSEWFENNTAIYTADEGFPGERARIRGSGSLRKYAYASVSVCPFDYRPLSGGLTHYDAVRVTVYFSVPPPGTPAAAECEMLRGDRTADERASELFVNYDRVMDLYETGRPAVTAPADTYDYVIITADSLTGAIAASGFIAWKISLGYSVRTVLVTDPEIAGQTGGDLAERIRSFLRAYYGTWGIQYVLIVGDYATVPMRYCFPNPDDHTHNPGNSGSPGGSVPTDFYYADLSLPDADSWDSDGDGYYCEYLQDDPDFLAEVYVGRIPTSDTDRITYALDKLADFEWDLGSWKTRALQPGTILFYENQDLSGYPKIDGCTLLNQIETNFLSGWTVSRYSEQAGIDPSAFPWAPVSMSAFIDDWRTGQYGVVNWSGHGAPYGVGRTVWDWDDGDGVPEMDGSDGMSHPMLIDCWCSLDDDYPSIVFAVSCNVGYPEPNGVGNLGIDLLTKPGFGAAAGIVSSTRPAWISADVVSNPGGAESVCYEFNRYGIAENEKLGEALYDAKHYCYQYYAWDHYAEHINQCNFNLYGDPSMMREGVYTAVDGGETPGARSHALLRQNYPNPFNPTTVIGFDLARPMHARLSIYNVKGELVAVLVDGHMPEGRNEVTWSGNGIGGGRVASGIYFYRLAAGDLVRTRTMVLLR